MSTAWKLPPTSRISAGYPRRWYLSHVTAGLRGRALPRAQSRLHAIQSADRLDNDKEVLIWNSQQPLFAGPELVLRNQPAPQPQIDVMTTSITPQVLPVSPGTQAPAQHSVFSAGNQSTYFEKSQASAGTIVESQPIKRQASAITSHPAGTGDIPLLSTAAGVADSGSRALTGTAAESAATGPAAASSRGVTTLPEIDPTTLTPALAKAYAQRQREWRARGFTSGQTSKSRFRAWLRYVMVVIMLISLVVIGSVVVPDLYYRFNPENSSEVITLPKEQLGETIAETTAPSATLNPEPPIDVTLPEGSWLIIPSIGVDTQLEATENPNDALSQGAWLVPDFGRPNDTSLPIIAAAHRFGWNWWWQSDFGRKHSFYSLPELAVGDSVEIVYNQRKYIYTVYDQEEGQAITDYSADLILYTCKYFNSPERYFTYANRNTQAELSTQVNNTLGETAAGENSLASLE